MSLNRRIFVSAPRTARLVAPDPSVVDPRPAIKDAIVQKIRAAGYKPQMFLTPSGGEGLVPDGWTLNGVEAVMRRCAGAVLIGVPFFHATLDGRQISLPTDYCQYEGAVARTLRLPILSISIDIERRILFDDHQPVTSIAGPLQEDVRWLESPAVKGLFSAWAQRVDSRQDVFLAYSSKSERMASQVKALVEATGASVLDWKSDFVAGSTILSSVTAAADTCTCGIFIFGEDDSIVSGDQLMAPRDNVVFEAGYFMRARGHTSCLIIRRGTTKMPADLGGIIYLPLSSTARVSTLTPHLTRFLTENLSRNAPDE
jgi:hypothetical protein